MPKFESYDYEGYKFVFKRDSSAPEMLHIWARHRKTVQDAVRIWFEGMKERWNLSKQRYETFTLTEGLYWIWLEEDKTVMIISCFDK